MFSSQKFSLFLGLSLLVLSVVSANESNAQTAEVATLEPTTQKASGSSGGENIARAAVINSLNANSLLNSSLDDNSALGNNSARSEQNSSATAGNASSPVSADNPAPESSVAEAQPSEGAALTDEISNNNAATSHLNQNSATDELSQLVDTADELLNYPPGIQLPSPGGILPNPPTPEVPPVPGVDSGSPSTPTSIPEPSMSLISGLGLVTAGLLSHRSRSKKG